MIEIIPAILTDSSVKFKDLVLRLEPYANRIHVDIADGVFVPNKTINGYEEIREIETTVKFDIHLMVASPSDLVKEWTNAYVNRIIIHAEAEGNLEEIISEVKNNKIRAGLAIKPETSIETIAPYLKQIDFVQFMTVHPGFQGGEFVKEVVDKIASFHHKYPGILIMCDGGITPETAPDLVSAGASELVSGSYIIKSPDVGKAIEQIKKVV
jgi:ribulose-phosphate 3-epimerase